MGYCCTDFMTNCKHSVSIGWLKDFILDNIRKSDGSVFTISDSWDNSYTPTYAELTGGTLIQQYVDGGTDRWSSNIDGIKIEGSYTDDSTVKGVDVVLYYTRTGIFEITANKTTFSECGDSTNINYTCGFSKVTKRLNSDCDIITSTVYGSDTSLTPRYSSSESWLTVSGNEINAAKNGSISSSTRNSIVTAKVTIKGEEHTSNSITITQNALTGSYETNGTKTIDSFTFVGTPSSHVIGCEGGNIKMESTVVVKERHYWVDSCNRKYETVYNDTFETVTDTQTGSFDKKECPIEEYAEQKTLSYTYSGVTKAITFTQDCSQSCCQATGYTPTSCSSPIIPVAKCGESNTIDFSVLQYCSDPLDTDTSIPYTDFVVTWEHVNGTDDFVTFTGDKKLTWNGKPNCNGLAKNAQYKRIVKTQDGLTTIQECTYTFTQTAEKCENCECDCVFLSFDKDVEYYKTNKIDRDGGTFTYTYSFDQCTGSKNVTVEKGNLSDSWYSINHDQSNSTIEVTVNARTSTDDGEAEIIVFLNSEECARITFIQEAGCACDDVQVSTNSIPQTGLTANSSIGAYTSSNGCSPKLMLESNDLNIAFSNGDIKILESIPANIGETPDTFTISKKVSVNNCDDIVLTQPAMGICDAATINFSNNEIPSTGINSFNMGTIDIDENVINWTDVAVFVNNVEKPYTRNVNTIYLDCFSDANTGGTSINHNVLIKIRGTECTSKIFSQMNYVCSCTDAGALTAITEILNGEGEPAGKKVATYTPNTTNTGNICSNNISFKSPTLGDLRLNGNDIELISVLGENVSEGEMTHYIYPYMGQNRCDDKVVTVKQMAKHICSCDDLVFEQTYTDTIPYTGIQSKTRIEIAQYSVENDCTADIDNTAVCGAVSINLTKEFGKIYINGGVPQNITPDPRTFIANIYINGEECSEKISLTQAGMVTCGCQNFNFSLNSDISQNGIPANGLGEGSVIGSYGANGTCDSGEPEFYYSINGGEEVALSKNNANVVIDSNSVIDANYTTEIKTFRFIMKVNGSECTSYTKTQPIICSCSNLSSVTLYDISSSGSEEGAIVGEYILDDNGCINCYGFVLSGSNDATITLVPIIDSSELQLEEGHSIPANESTDETVTYKIIVNFGNTECQNDDWDNSKIQPSSPSCDCDCITPYSGKTFIPKVISKYGVDVIQDGETRGSAYTNTSVGGIMFDSGCTDFCGSITGNTDLSNIYMYSSNSMKLVYAGTTDVFAIPRFIDEWPTYIGFNVVNPISANTSNEYNEFYLDLMVNGVKCGESIKIAQESDTKSCGCDAIHTFIPEHRKTVPLSAQSNYIIFSADTYGCGKIEINLDNQADMFEGGLPKVTVTSGSIYTVYADILSAATDRSASGQIKYIPNKENDSGCTEEFCLKQTSSYISEPKIKEYYEVPGCNKVLSGTSGLTNQFALTDAEWPISYISAITADAEWIEFKHGSSRNWWYALNSSTNEERECEVTLHISIPETGCDNVTENFEKDVITTFRQKPQITDCDSLKAALSSIKESYSYTYDSEKGLFVRDSQWKFDASKQTSDHINDTIYAPYKVGGVLKISDEEHFYIKFSESLSYGYARMYIYKRDNSYIGDKILYVNLELCNGTQCPIYEIDYVEEATDVCDCNKVSFRVSDLKIYNNTINDYGAVYVDKTNCSAHTYSAYTCNISGAAETYDWLIFNRESDYGVYDAFYTFTVNDAMNTVPQNADAYVKIISNDCEKEDIAHAYKVNEYYIPDSIEYTSKDKINNTNFGNSGETKLIGTALIEKETETSSGRKFNNRHAANTMIEVVPQDTTFINALSGSTIYAGEITENGKKYYGYDAYVTFLEENLTGRQSVNVNFSGNTIWTTIFTE